jgi:hypothetical protein
MQVNTKIVMTLMAAFFMFSSASSANTGCCKITWRLVAEKSPRQHYLDDLTEIECKEKMIEYQANLSKKKEIDISYVFYKGARCRPPRLWNND